MIPKPSQDRNQSYACFAALNFGGLFISASRLAELAATPLPALPYSQAEQLRRCTTAFDGEDASFSALLDFILQDFCGLPAEEWQKAQEVAARWAMQSYTGVQVKPRRVWQGPQGEILPLFVPQEGASRMRGGRLGVGKTRHTLGRVVEWLRRMQQPLAIVTNGRQWRLVHAGSDYEAFCEFDIDLWFEEGQPGAQTLAWRYLLSRASLLADKAVAQGGQSRLLAAIRASRKGQAELSAVLGERVRQAVEELITASHSALLQAEQHRPSNKDLYLAGSRIIMRLIITLFAEARALLPVDNPIYHQAYSLEGLRQQLDRRRGERLNEGNSAWPRIIALFNLIYAGSAHAVLPVPQYSGDLFAPGDAHSSNPVSRALAILEGSSNTISDRQILSLLRLLTRTKAKIQQGKKSTWVDSPVDFSTLSSEYIGILYEGLLDFELKQANGDDPVLFLAVGNQPALPLSQLEAMDDKAIKQLFDALKKKDKASDGEDDGGGEGGEDDDAAPEEAEPDALETLETVDAGDETEIALEDSQDNLPLASEDVAEDAQTHMQFRQRAQTWLEKAAALAGQEKGKRKKPSAEEAQKAAKALCARLIAPGQFYLVRWGGTRKGAGTFYTRPQLAAPTVRRTLQTLAYEAVRREVDARTGLEEVVEWIPKKPAEILALKVCDPAMGSGSFLAAALRYLTDALLQSLFHYQLIRRSEDGGVPRMADGEISQVLGDELLKLRSTDEGFEEALRAQLKRHIVERCLYGVDLDPLAVELGRMALWVETMDRDLPFGFLDHKLKVGNALVGAWFDTYRDYPAMAWEREGGDKDYQKGKPDYLINHFYMDDKGKKLGDKFTQAIKQRGKYVPEQLVAILSGQQALGQEGEALDIHKELLAVFKKLHRLPVHEADKRAKLYRDQVLNNPHYHALKNRMDLWCALWFWPGEQINQAPLPAEFPKPDAQSLALAAELAEQYHFFHWELEFPDVFSAQQQGFDAIVGNPPWEIQKPNSKEFFSNHDPMYRAYGKQEALVQQLAYFQQSAQLEHDWLAYNAKLKSMSNWVKYVGQPFGDNVITLKDGKRKHGMSLGKGRDSFAASARLHALWQKQRKKRTGFSDTNHPFLHQGSADLNTYKMFLEQSHALLHAHGRMGLIVPSGIYTDKGTSALRELFLDHCDWQWLFGFENREKIFDIHPSFKFCPLLVNKGGTTQAVRTAFMRRNIDDWEQAHLHVLAYPRQQVAEFSPFSKAVLEIRNEKDLHVLQKIYANGVLVSDSGESGWGVQYGTDFHMTSDSKLFPPRPKWEEAGYQPDEYGHWLKGPWQPVSGEVDILLREPDTVLSQDGQHLLRLDEIEDVAIPLYEGRMIGQFNFCEKGWISGKGRTAVWQEITAEKKTFLPQYLISLQVAYENGFQPERRLAFMDICSATNARTFIGAVVPSFPCGNSVPVLKNPQHAHVLCAVLNSFAADKIFRLKVGGLHLNWYYMEEAAIIKNGNARVIAELSHLAQRLNDIDPLFAENWQPSTRYAWRRLWALTPYERLRLRCIIDALVAQEFALAPEEFAHLLEACDWPQEKIKRDFASLNPKGFWRIDKEQDPELRHTVLSLIAFHDLQAKGLEAFLAQNDGEAWLLPETLCLADYGLGHDERAQQPQPVAERLGPRFYDWQLAEDVSRSWQECAAHAALILRIAPPPEDVLADEFDAAEIAPPAPTQGDLF